MSELNRDLGLGGKLAREASVRLLNQDGSFNARRLGHSRWHPVNAYHTLIELKPSRLIALSLLGYLLVNCFFALLYFACGEGALDLQGNGHMSRLESCFYFSVQTIGTIGYGKMVPVSRAANLLVAVEALFGLVGFAVLSALIYARLTRPEAEIVFSNRALIAPYEGGWALMTRLANQRRSNLTEARATLTIARWVKVANGERKRKFDSLELERDRVVFMPLQWVLVHPIDAKSPLYGMTKQQMSEAEPEIFILLSADEDTFAVTVHSRTSYQRHEIVWGAKFDDMYIPHSSMVVVDLAKIHGYAMLPEAPSVLS